MQAAQIKKMYGDHGTVIPGALKGDDHVFVILDLNKGDDAIPHLMVGGQVEGVVENCLIGREAWDIEYYKENIGAKAKLRGESLASDRAKLFKEYGIEGKQETTLDKLRKLESENAELRTKFPVEEDEDSQTAPPDKDGSGLTQYPYNQ